MHENRRDLPPKVGVVSKFSRTLRARTPLLIILDPPLVFWMAVSIATNSLVSITATKMLLTPTRRVGVNIGQKSAIATNSSSDWRNYSVGVNNGHKIAIGTNLTLCMLFVILYLEMRTQSCMKSIPSAPRMSAQCGPNVVWAPLSCCSIMDIAAEGELSGNESQSCMNPWSRVHPGCAQCRPNECGCYRVVISGGVICSWNDDFTNSADHELKHDQNFITAGKILRLIICSHSHLTTLEAAQCIRIELSVHHLGALADVMQPDWVSFMATSRARPLSAYPCTHCLAVCSF